MKDGKLFGKINIIDLLVILLVAAAAVFLALRLSNRGTPGDVPTSSRIRYVVKVLRVDPELYEAAKARIDAGETQLLAGEDLIDGHVVDVRSTPQIATMGDADGQYVYTEDPYYLNVYFTVEAATSNSVTNLVSTQEIRLGAVVWVKTLGSQFSGTVIDLETIG